MKETNLNLRKQNFNYYGKGSQLVGKISLKGETFISCEIEGTVHISDDSDLTLEKLGTIKGEVHAHDFKIFGKVVGSIRSSGKVTLYPGSYVEGEITAENIVINPGANANLKAHTL